MQSFSLKVSIVTVSYNCAATIEQTIQSVLSQDYNNVEYIIIDGGSTDGTIEIIRRYESKLKYWNSEPDSGISDAFNKGIKYSTGEVVGLLNADDLYLPNAISTAVHAFQDNQEAGFVFGDQMFIDQSGKLLWKQTGDPDFTQKIQQGMPSIPHPTVFVRRTVYESCGLFNLNYKTAMDYELLLRFANVGIKGLYLPVLMASMRLGGESDNNYMRGYAEVRDISIKYGLSPVLAYRLYFWRTAKTSLKRALEHFGFAKLVMIYRSLFSDRYSYN